MFKDLQQNIESGYVDGKPLHHLPSARSVKHLPDASSVFVVEHADFIAMTPGNIQNIFRDRHILVTGVPQEEQHFDEESLSIFGDIDLPREINGAPFLLFFHLNNIYLFVLFLQSCLCATPPTALRVSNGALSEICWSPPKIPISRWC
ncbi:MAG: hypothetical protein QOE33_3688 [Acidobacteriota bacterium]|nr:hypothetical protein [Acidobacteriota bacterium]